MSDLRGVDLTAEEGYLLSRIDGRVNVGALISLVSWPREKTMALLENLLRKHVLNFDRKEIQDQVFSTSKANADVVVSPGMPGAPADGGSRETERPPIDPDSIEKVPDLDTERCVEILQWLGQVDEAETPFELFGLPEGAEPKSVKRRYRAMALSFHPDNFFRKEIGGYRARIDTSWKRVQDAYDLLSDEGRRAAYEAHSNPESRKKPSKPVWTGEKQEDSGPGRAPAGMSQPMIISPLDDFESPDGEPGSSGEETAAPRAEAVPPKRRVESKLSRQVKAGVQARMEKARVQFVQAQSEFKDGKLAAADSNAKLAMQYDPLNEEYKSWYEAVRPKLEEGIIKTLMAKGANSMSMRDPKGALQTYEHALTLFPENVEANEAVGLLLASRGEELKKAKDCLQKVVQRRPRNLEALLSLGRVLRMLGMSKNAERVLAQAKGLAPRDARVLQEIKELKRAT